MKKARIEINLENLVYNFQKLRNNVKYPENIIPVVKANAYNVGVYEVVNSLLNIKNPPEKYFVFSLNEGIELRNLFPKLKNIFIFNGIFSGEEKYFKKYKLTPVINSFEELKFCKEFSINNLVLQFNTGMNRAGIEVNQIDHIKNYIKENSINILMVISHLCCANSKENLINLIQIENFKKVIEYFPEKHILKSLAASDALNNLNLQDIFNSYRPGLILYGYYENFKPVYSIFSYIKFDGENFYLPLGLKNGFTSNYGNKNSYIVCNTTKINIKLISNDKIILNTNDKNLIDKEAIVLDNNFVSYKDFESMSEININEAVARIISNCDYNPLEFSINTTRKRKIYNKIPVKAYYKLDDKNNYKEFISTIIEKREINKKGIVGYGATKDVKKGDKLAVFFGGYLDGISREISNKNCTVFVENKNKKLIECEIFARISMDQTIIKISNNEFKNIEVGSKVIIFDDKHPIEKFEKFTKKSKEELFFYLNKNSRILRIENL